MEDELTLESIFVIGHFSDGTMRQILVKKHTEEIISSVIVSQEGAIKITSSALENICIDSPTK